MLLSDGQSKGAESAKAWELRVKCAHREGRGVCRGSYGLGQVSRAQMMSVVFSVQCIYFNIYFTPIYTVHMWATFFLCVPKSFSLTISPLYVDEV